MLFQIDVVVQQHQLRLRHSPHPAMIVGDDSIRARDTSGCDLDRVRHPQPGGRSNARRFPRQSNVQGQDVQTLSRDAASLLLPRRTLLLQPGVRVLPELPVQPSHGLGETGRLTR